MKLPHDSQASNVPHIKEDIGTVTIRFNQKTTLKKLEQLLQQLLWDDTYKPLKILRLKANVNIVKENDHVEGVLVQGASSQICISVRHSGQRYEKKYTLGKLQHYFPQRFFKIFSNGAAPGSEGACGVKKFSSNQPHARTLFTYCNIILAFHF